MVGSDILEPGHSTHGCGLHGDSVREIHNTTDPIERRLCIHSQKRVGALKREHKKRVAINWGKNFELSPTFASDLSSFTKDDDANAATPLSDRVVYFLCSLKKWKRFLLILYFNCVFFFLGVKMGVKGGRRLGCSVLLHDMQVDERHSKNKSELTTRRDTRGEGKEKKRVETNEGWYSMVFSKDIDIDRLLESVQRVQTLFTSSRWG